MNEYVFYCIQTDTFHFFFLFNSPCSNLQFLVSLLLPTFPSFNHCCLLCWKHNSFPLFHQHIMVLCYYFLSPGYYFVLLSHSSLLPPFLPGLVFCSYSLPSSSFWYIVSFQNLMDRCSPQIRFFYKFRSLLSLFVNILSYILYNTFCCLTSS